MISMMSVFYGASLDSNSTRSISSVASTKFWDVITSSTPAPPKIGLAE